MARLHRWLRGRDTGAPPGWPVGEVLHPLTLAAGVILIINDWLLKPSSVAGAITGKLSDVAGLVIAPLLLTALYDCLLRIAWGVGAKVDPRLRSWKLAAAITLTASIFTLTKLSPTAAAVVAALMPGNAHIVVDPTDLAALPALALAAWIGHTEMGTGS